MVGVTGSIPVAPTIFFALQHPDPPITRRACAAYVVSVIPISRSEDMGSVELPAVALIGLLFVTVTVAAALVWLAKSVSIA